MIEASDTRSKVSDTRSKLSPRTMSLHSPVERRSLAAETFPRAREPPNRRRWPFGRRRRPQSRGGSLHGGPTACKRVEPALEPIPVAAGAGVAGGLASIPARIRPAALPHRRRARTVLLASSKAARRRGGRVAVSPCRLVAVHAARRSRALDRRAREPLAVAPAPAACGRRRCGWDRGCRTAEARSTLYGGGASLSTRVRRCGQLGTWRPMVRWGRRWREVVAPVVQAGGFVR